MLKTKEELNVLKQEYETLTAKLKSLSDEELRIVMGGIDMDNEVVTRMECDLCGYFATWSGDYYGKTFECPRCHAMSLVGVSKKG